MQRTKVLLILDNCPAHTKLKNTRRLSNTEVFYLPPNTTSKLQPCDARVNRSFKAYYRRNFHQQLLESIENGIVDPVKVDMVEVIKMCIEAWDNVKASTIRNCFQHCNIRTRSISTPTINANMIDEPALIQELNNQLAQFPISNIMDINFLLNYPSEVRFKSSPLMMKSYNKLMFKSRRIFHPGRWVIATSPKKYLLRKFSNYLI